MSPDVEFVAAHEDLMKALRALAAFTVKDVDSLSRIRFTLAGQRLYATATNGISAGLAHVGVISADTPDGHDGVVEVDMSGDQAKKVMAAFKASGKEDEDGPGRELQVAVDSEHITFTDVSGFLDGQELILPLLPRLESGPRTLRGFSKRLTMGHQPHKARPPAVSPKQLHLMNAAAAIYGHHLILEHDATTSAQPHQTGRVFARIGEQFLGYITEVLFNEEETRDRTQWRKDWVAQLSNKALSGLSVAGDDQ